MSSDLEKISSFLKKHHVLTLATSDSNELSACSLFYSYCENTISFIVASSDETQHIQNINQDNRVAGNILLETKTVGKIQGVQFRGEFLLLTDTQQRKSYFQSFPQAIVMKPKLWQIKINYFKMTDNMLGFGKKIIWLDSSL